MCGIAGIFSSIEITQRSEKIKKMTDKLAHRGPDSEGYYNDVSISLGHRRLSIIDLGIESNQPMTDKTERFVIVYNGEIYNYLDIKKDLQEFEFKTNSDTEVLLYGYIKYREKILSKLNGMFAFAIFDKITKELFVGRDRLGKKPLYYFHDKNTFIFSSELRSILSCGLIPKNLNSDAVADFFMFQSNSNPLTIIENIFQLMPGQYGIYKNSIFETKYYWKISDNNFTIQNNHSEILRTTKHLLLKAVEKRLISDVPLGVWLSGGIDSSALVALMYECSDKPINSFSIDFEEKEYDESEYSQLISKKYNTNHTSIKLSPKNLIDNFPEIIQTIDTPNIDGANIYLISKLTKAEGITTVLSGLGGDEVFGGYSHFEKWVTLYKYRNIWNNSFQFRKLFIPIINKFFNGYSKKKLLELLKIKDLRIESIYPYFRMLFTPDEIKSFLNADANVKNTIEYGLQNHENLSKYSPFSQLSIAELISYTGNTLLECTDKMSMSHSLEVRAPFLDYELIEYVLNVPDRFKISDKPKTLLIDSMGELLPDEIIYRKKKGFSFPWEIWLRNDLKELASYYIDYFSKREIIKKSKVQEIWEDFISENPRIRYSKILTFIYLEAWLQKNFD